MTALPLRPGVSRINSVQSNSEDFRSVIDDLTVENKRLKRKLRKLERLHSSQLQEDKLFEVRVHKLPAFKKRELEGTLREFASSLDTSPEPSPKAPVGSHPSMNPSIPPLKAKLSTLSTSLYRPVDSAYASMSASGKTSMSQLQYSKNPMRTEPQESLDQNIKSYLHDIPQGLLPREAPFMTEKAKTKLVVRRLEQLFTGKGPSSTHTSHSLQQQQISQSAADDELNANKARGKEVGVEGNREARILPADLRNTSEMIEESRVCAPLRTPDDGDDCNASMLNTSSEGTPDQRPTRPLDLDPHRAQIPSENVEYIRHLGLAPPNLNPDSDTSDSKGWVYLNLLMGMAQLHTINVTASFVKKAIRNFSERLELSEDAQKIRWKGGSQGTHMSSDSDSYPDFTDRPLPGSVRQPSAYHYTLSGYGGPDYLSQDSSGVDPTYRTQKHSVSFGAESLRRPIFLGQIHDNRCLNYEPLFFHGTRSEEEEDYYLHDGDSLMSSAWAEDVHGEAADLNETTCDGTSMSVRKRGKEGPIVFYSRVKFCTDLSGDVDITPCKTNGYSKPGQDAIGFRSQTTGLNERFSEMEHWLSGQQRSESLQYSDDSILNWPIHSFDDASKEDKEDVNTNRNITSPFAASGVGGIQPADHFTVYVDVHHWNANGIRNLLPYSNLDIPHLAYTPGSKPLGAANTSRPTYGPSNTLGFQSKIIRTIKIILEPSILPSPSHVVLPSSMTESVGDDADSLDLDDVRSAVYSHLMDSGQSGNPVSVSSPVGNVRLEYSTDTSDVSSEDSSMDLLAHARELDPDTIAAQEREFEDHAFQMATFIQERENPFALRGKIVASIEGSCSTSAFEVGEDAISSRSLKRERSVDHVYRSNKKARLLMDDDK